jgi:hypothetical protein
VRREQRPSSGLRILSARPASRIACRARSGVAGISMCSTPSFGQRVDDGIDDGRKRGMVPPAGPQPRPGSRRGTSLTAVWAQGVCRRAGVIHEDRRPQPAAGVVAVVIPERLAQGRAMPPWACRAGSACSPSGRLRRPSANTRPRPVGPGINLDIVHRAAVATGRYAHGLVTSPPTARRTVTAEHSAGARRARFAPLFRHGRRTRAAARLHTRRSRRGLSAPRDLHLAVQRDDRRQYGGRHVADRRPALAVACDPRSTEKAGCFTT